MKLNFQDWINKANPFQDWEPKYGTAYLRVLEISANIALKRKYMTAYFKSFHRQTTNDVIHSLIVFAIILELYLKLLIYILYSS